MNKLEETVGIVLDEIKPQHTELTFNARKSCLNIFMTKRKDTWDISCHGQILTENMSPLNTEIWSGQRRHQETKSLEHQQKKNHI